MRKISYILGYLGYIMAFLIALVPAGLLSIFIDFKSADSIFFYSIMLLLIISILVLYKSNMNKLKNIILLIVLYITIIIMPHTLVYILGPSLGTIDIDWIENKSYFNYLITRITAESTFLLYFPSVIFNALSIIGFIVDYVIRKYNKLFQNIN